MSQENGTRSGTGRLLSYSQNFEDVLLWRVFRHLDTGFYVDVGANSPELFSMTRLFYEHGWSGINIEPVDEWFHQLMSSRPRDTNLRLCINDTGGTVELVEVPESGLSTTDRALGVSYAETYETRTVRREAATLASVLDEHGADELHFLSIDVEGMEEAVLAGADFTRHRPWVVVIESVHPVTQEPSHAGWEPILLDADYELLWFDGLNRFYGARERHDDVAPHFVVPPNVFDGFAWVDEYEAAEHHSRGERLHQLSAQHHSTRQELDATHSLLRNELSRAEQLERHAEALEVRARAVEAELTTLHDSASWRLTAPLRRLLGYSRRLVDARRHLRR